ncbi:Leucine-rich repeat serine/threonine-protein kinase 2 [Entophlyctis luteolus]|nr:Leucine-rich repeat serine/threonine-protein kinase 2 [Entophlyctis luteolus]
MDILHQALQLAASTPIPFIKEIASLGLSIWTACDQRRANNAALHALRDKVALVVVTLERKCQTEGTTVAASEHLPQLRYWLEEVSEWIAKQAARGALVQVARANVVRDKAGLYADKLAFYIQVFQLAAVPWTGQGADRDLQPVLEKILRVATADIVASIERDLDGMRAELAALMEQNAKETVDAVLGRLDIVNSNMVDSVGLLDCLLSDAVARMGNMDQNIKRVIQTLERRSGFTVSAGSVQRLWSVIREDELSHWSAQPIGSGSFGVVHRAQWGTAKVAVKRVVDVLHNQTVRAAVTSEVATWSRLNHPNVVRLFGACMDTDRPFIVMKYFHLGSLAKYLDTDSSIPRSQRVKWMLEVCLGLSHIHKEGIIHGDLKSDNVLLDEVNGDIVAQITDFGLSAFKSFGAKSKEKTMADSKTLSGAFRWRAPESYDRVYRRDFPLDVFAFGMTIYEIFSGQLPFHGEYNGEMIRDWIRAGEAPWEPSEKEQAADDCFWDIIAKCIKTDVKQRASLAEVQSQLEIERARIEPSSENTPSSTLQNDGTSDSSAPKPNALSRNVQDNLSPSSSISTAFSGSQFLLTDLGEFSVPAVKFWKTWCLDDSKMTWDNFCHGLFLELGALGKNKIDTELLKDLLGAPGGGSQGPSLPAFKTFVQANSVKGFPGMFQFAVMEGKLCCKSHKSSHISSDEHAIACKSCHDAYNQAQHYEDGSGGLARSAASAVRFYKAAADERYPLAQAKMAGIYLHGLLGLSKNMDLAIEYINLALGTADVNIDHFANSEKWRIEKNGRVKYMGPSLVFSGKGELLDM